MQPFTAIRSLVFQYPKTVALVTVTGNSCTVSLSVCKNEYCVKRGKRSSSYGPVRVLDHSPARWWSIICCAVRDVSVGGLCSLKTALWLLLEWVLKQTMWAFITVDTEDLAFTCWPWCCLCGHRMSCWLHVVSLTNTDRCTMDGYTDLFIDLIYWVSLEKGIFKSCKTS